MVRTALILALLGLLGRPAKAWRTNAPPLVWRSSKALNRSKALTTTTTMRLSSSNNSNDSAPEYRSIADVVGGLHGGKYQFGDNSGMISSDDAFGGSGGSSSDNQQQNPVALENLPKWAQAMAPSSIDAKPLRVPSNANPMDGMVYSASFEIRNDEWTWETFYTKLITMDNNEKFVMIENAQTVGLEIAPSTGSLAPRGGASNACDSSQPYSDAAMIRVTQLSSAEETNNHKNIWLVVGTEEEQWTYQLELL